MSAISLPPHLGYLALFALVGAESAGLPVPGETALIAAALLARHGSVDIRVVVVVAAAAAIGGDNIGYLIGRTAGRTLLERPGLLERHRRRVLTVGEPFFERHGPKAVFLTRWVAGLRVAAAWLAGINRMSWPTFAVWNALGGIAWAASVGLLAYSLGSVVEHLLKVTGLAGIALGAALLVSWVLWRRRGGGRRLRRRSAPMPAATARARGPFVPGERGEA